LRDDRSAESGKTSLAIEREHRSYIRFTYARPGPVPDRLRRASPAAHEVHDERDDSENEQDVYQPARYVKNRKTQEPRNQQDYKQDRKDTHGNLHRITNSLLYAD